MRKFYYVCPRCGRCYKRYIPRRKAKCGFCSTVWKTRGAKGTRSAFSWTATLVFLAALAGGAFLTGRELGVLSKLDVWSKLDDFLGAFNPEEPRVEETEFAPSTESGEDASNEEIGETSEQTDSSLEIGETLETSEDAAAE